jgi:macrodomain Ter protein organizer (MatP/YcbG family)
MKKNQKAGRPKLSEEIKKSMPISINLSFEEKEKLENQARKKGLSLSSFIRFYLKDNEII